MQSCMLCGSHLGSCVPASHHTLEERSTHCSDLQPLPRSFEEGGGVSQGFTLNYAAQADPELTAILLSQSPEGSNHRPEPPGLFLGSLQDNSVSKGDCSQA